MRVFSQYPRISSACSLYHPPRLSLHHRHDLLREKLLCLRARRSKPRCQVLHVTTELVRLLRLEFHPPDPHEQRIECFLYHTSSLATFLPGQITLSSLSSASSIASINCQGAQGTLRRTKNSDQTSYTSPPLSVPCTASTGNTVSSLLDSRWAW
eukprot:766754-Hanusia_phi.AAC.2